MVSTVDLDSRVDALLASRPEAIADPFPLWRAVREQGPVYDAGSVVIVSHHAAVKRLLQEKGNSPAYTSRKDQGERAAAFVARLSAEEADAFREYYAFMNLFMVRSDGEEHARRRRIAHRFFTPRRIAEMQTMIERYTDELLDELSGRDEADLMEMGYRLPLRVIVDMLGCPPEDRERIHTWSMAIGSQLDSTDRDGLLAAVQAIREFRAYVDARIAEYRAGERAGTDLVATLLEASDDDRMTEVEVTATFVLLLFAGHETTTNLISLGALELLRRPSQWRMLGDDPSLVPGAVEELLRYVSPVQFTMAVTTRDVELTGMPVAAGRSVLAGIAAANRDPARFADPDVLDITRADAREHVALGFGPKFCLGASLARLEGAVSLRALIRRFPDMQLACDDFTYTGNALLRRLVELPVRPGTDRGRVLA